MSRFNYRSVIENLTLSGSQNTVEYRYLEVDGTIFYKFELPEVQLISGNLDL